MSRSNRSHSAPGHPQGDVPTSVKFQTWFGIVVGASLAGALVGPGRLEDIPLWVSS
jgi:hypothetical protein